MATPDSNIHGFPLVTTIASGDEIPIYNISETDPLKTTVRITYANFFTGNESGDLNIKNSSHGDNMILSCENAAGTPISLVTLDPDDSTVLIGMSSFLRIGRNSTTIAAGAVTAPSSYFRIDTEAAAATDDLNTITAPLISGVVVIMQSYDNARAVVVKHNTGNMLLNGGADFTLNNTADKICLIYDSVTVKWTELFRSNNA